MIGEVGLTGEVRAVTGVEARVKEAAALGFKEAVVPRSNVTEGARLALPVHPVTRVSEAIDALLA